jgi:hypothetical protein
MSVHELGTDANILPGLEAAAGQSVSFDMLTQSSPSMPSTVIDPATALLRRPMPAIAPIPSIRPALNGPRNSTSVRPTPTIAKNVPAFLNKLYK